MHIYSVLVLVLTWFSAGGCEIREVRSPGRPMTAREVASVVQALEDEIYDYEYATHYFQMGRNVGTAQNWRASLPVFIGPRIDEQGGGSAIYKLMPVGEVLRAFELGRDGVVTLLGNPQNGLPPTQPSVLTLFMDDDDVCAKKRRWLRRELQILADPTQDVIRAAVERQKVRTGFSEWEYRHKRRQED